MKAFVYILKDELGKYYVGSTDDLDRRFKQHVSGYTPTTKRMGELQIVVSQEYTTLKEARSVEYKIKTLKRKDYIEKIVKEGYIKIKP